ncbi:hypothetical protein [Arcticibacterium luteifluviistationis]|uniref:hypothetical protein n=1 Tax=Arcticibacterium luteifluviistationis TaxID=1784714 RepID=UPI0013A6F609|nr:hypothetical protein [Arcticibacterium luteifluviistationis]
MTSIKQAKGSGYTRKAYTLNLERISIVDSVNFLMLLVAINFVEYKLSRELDRNRTIPIHWFYSMPYYSGSIDCSITWKRQARRFYSIGYCIPMLHF